MAVAGFDLSLMREVALTRYACHLIAVCRECDANNPTPMLFQCMGVAASSV